MTKYEQARYERDIEANTVYLTPKQLTKDLGCAAVRGDFYTRYRKTSQQRNNQNRG